MISLRRAASPAWVFGWLALAAACGRGLPLDLGEASDAGVLAAVSGEAADGGAASDGGPLGALDGGSGPPYPLVLAHGFSGFRAIGPLEYFYRVPETLRADGHQVFVAEVDPFSDSYTRGAELLAYVKGVLATTGAAKVDLIAHSQGGLDARYVAHALPTGVAALVTIASPNHGTSLADLSLRGGESPLEGALLDLLGGVDGGTPPGILAAIGQLSTSGVAAFNAEITDAPSVDYYSLAGRSNLLLARDACQSAQEPAFVSRWDAFVDPMRPLFLATALVLSGDPFDPTPNDGLVTVASAHWGQFLGCVPADHLDEIGQILGESPGIGNPFAYLDFYRGLASWLVAQGY